MAFGKQASQNVTPISHNVLFILVANLIFINVIGLFVVVPPWLKGTGMLFVIVSALEIDENLTSLVKLNNLYDVWR